MKIRNIVLAIIVVLINVMAVLVLLKDPESFSLIHFSISPAIEMVKNCIELVIVNILMVISLTPEKSLQKEESY